MRIALIVTVVLALAASAHAWGPEPVVVEANPYVEDYMSYGTFSDGEGGVIVIWSCDWFGTSPAGAQRIGRQGELLWGQDGISLFEGKRVVGPKVVLSGVRGAVILGWSEDGWLAQRLSLDGRKNWEEGGISLGIHGLLVSAVPDGTGGAIVVAWPYGGGDAYIQRVDGDGMVRWGAGGKYLGETEGSIKLFPDGNGGAIAIADFSKAWKVGADGRISWSADLEAGMKLPEALPGPTFRLKKEGGAYYIQKFDERLNPMFGADGIRLDIEANRYLFLAGDGRNGAFIAWWDEDPAEYPVNKRVDGYAQRIGPDGKVLWGPVRFAEDIPEPIGTRLLPDGKGGVFIAFTDWFMNKEEHYNKKEVSAYLQRVDRNGMTWDSPIVLGRSNSRESPRLVSDGKGGVIVSWVWEGRIYVQHVSGEGEVGANYTSVKTGMMEVPEEFRLGQNIPNPFNSLTMIPYSVPEGKEYDLEIYNVLGQKIRKLVEGGKYWGRQHAIWDGRDEMGREVTSGVYVYELRAGRFKESRKMILAR